MEMTREQFIALKDYKKDGLRTGFVDFDVKNFIGKKDFVVLSGGTGGGKSTVAIWIACNMAKAGHKVVYINVENPDIVIYSTIKLLGFDWEKDFGEFDKNNCHRFVIENEPIKFDALSKLITLHKADCLFIDTWESLTLDYIGFDKQIASSKFAYALGKNGGLPTQTNCCIITLHQLTKDATRVRRPTENDIAGSASISQQAHKIIIAHRHLLQNPELALKNSNQEEYQSDIIKNTVELIVRKEREGSFTQFKTGTYLYRLHDTLGYLKLNQYEREEYTRVMFPQNKGWKK